MKIFFLPIKSLLLSLLFITSLYPMQQEQAPEGATIYLCKKNYEWLVVGSLDSPYDQTFKISFHHNVAGKRHYFSLDKSMTQRMVKNNNLEFNIERVVESIKNELFKTFQKEKEQFSREKKELQAMISDYVEKQDKLLHLENDNQNLLRRVNALEKAKILKEQYFSKQSNLRKNSYEKKLVEVRNDAHQKSLKITQLRKQLQNQRQKNDGKTFQKNSFNFNQYLAFGLTAFISTAATLGIVYRNHISSFFTALIH